MSGARPMSSARTVGLERHVRERRAKKPLLLMAHAVVGYPSLDATWTMLEAMDEAGVDLVELQLPFTEPIADGPSFVKANHEAIQAGTAWQAYFELAARAATRFGFPVLFMGYYNSVFRMGAERFCARLSEAGMSGFILADLPPEEADDYEQLMRQAGLCNIYLIAPTTPEERIALIVKRGAGFIYCISREGVTGMQEKVAGNIAQMTGKIRAYTNLPIAVGFGISNPEQARFVAQNADAVVVGSAVVNQVAQHGRSPELVPRVTEFVKSLASALKA